MTWLKAKLGGLAIGLGMAAAEPDWQLERQQALHQIPGISSLAWTPEGLYVLADNIPLLYRLDAEGEIKQRISLDPERPDPAMIGTMPKPLKPDFEASTLSPDGCELWIYGSGSLAGSREQSLCVELASGKLRPRSMAPAYRALAAAIAGEVNIEGAAWIGKALLLANRGHTGQALNQLVWLAPEQAHLEALQTLSLPVAAFAGISGLDYDPAQDRLWFTASTEATASVYDDGAIGDSYLGWIDRFADRRSEPALTPDGLINLSRLDPAFAGQKIEGLALAPDRIWLGADNDGGHAFLFALKRRTP